MCRGGGEKKHRAGITLPGSTPTTIVRCTESVDESTSAGGVAKHMLARLLLAGRVVGQNSRHYPAQVLENSSQEYVCRIFRAPAANFEQVWPKSGPTLPNFCPIRAGV